MDESGGELRASAHAFARRLRRSSISWFELLPAADPRVTSRSPRPTAATSFRAAVQATRKVSSVIIKSSRSCAIRFPLEVYGRAERAWQVMIHVGGDPCAEGVEVVDRSRPLIPEVP
jgi:hypothetical protein